MQLHAVVLLIEISTTVLTHLVMFSHMTELKAIILIILLLFLLNSCIILIIITILAYYSYFKINCVMIIINVTSLKFSEFMIIINFKYNIIIIIYNSFVPPLTAKQACLGVI